jgi:hypothetical protein
VRHYFSLYFINSLHTTNQLDRFGVIAIKLPLQKDLLVNELDDMKTDMPVFQSKDRLSGDIYVSIRRLFEEVLWGVLCNCIYSQTALAFVAGNSMEGLSSQRIKYL